MAQGGERELPDLRSLSSFEEALALACDGEVPAELVAQCKALPPKEHEGLWRTVLDLVGEQLSEKGDPEGERAREVAARCLQALATLLVAFVEGAPLQPALPPAFTEAALLCQEMLMSVRDGATQALIADALERLSLGDFENREDFYGGVLMYCIGRCQERSATNGDVARLHKVLAPIFCRECTMIISIFVNE